MDRVRESLFSILAGTGRAGLVLDLFAGSGSLGLEALSRGAAGCWFVESNRGVAKVLRENIEKTGLAGCSLFVGAVDEALGRLARAGTRFNLVFLDPPYRKGLVERTLGRLDGLALLAPGGRIVAEHESGLLPPAEVGNLFRTDARTYGDTGLSFYSILDMEMRT
jgi:16S rRNA (guanine(966)-N(2))-methyltransferase RsmD